MKYIIIFSLFFTLSCYDKNYPKSNDKDCLNYFKLIKKDWKQDNDGIFYFKSLKPFTSTYPEIFEKSIQLKEVECVVGITEKEVDFLFGAPTKTSPTNIGKVYSYCMRVPNCINDSSKNLKIPRLTISIDTIKNRVDHIYF